MQKKILQTTMVITLYENFDLLPNFPFTTTYKWNEAWLLVINWYIRVASGVAKQLLRLRNLGNQRKVQNNVKTSLEVWPSAQSSSLKENFINTSKRLLENRNWTFPVVHYFTWKLEFFSNILSMLVARYKY